MPQDSYRLTKRKTLKGRTCLRPFESLFSEMDLQEKVLLDQLAVDKAVSTADSDQFGNSCSCQKAEKYISL